MASSTLAGLRGGCDVRIVLAPTWKGAKRFLEKATKYDPNMTAAWRELGVAYAKLGDKPNAEATLAGLQAKATACAGTCPTAGELKMAVDAVTAALSGAPTASLAPGQSLLFASSAAGDSLYLDAVALINDRRYEDAIAALKSAQASFGPHPDILTYLGFANRKLKRFDVAESYYLAALAVAPTHRGATEYYGELMVERGDLAGAKLKLAALDSHDDTLAKAELDSQIMALDAQIDQALGEHDSGALRVLEAQRRIRDEVERAPAQFLFRRQSSIAGARQGEPSLVRQAAAAVAAVMSCPRVCMACPSRAR